MPIDPTQTGAPVGTITPPAAGDGTPPASGESAAPSVQIDPEIKRLRDLNAQRGRELQQTQTALEQTQSALAGQQGQLQQLTGAFTQLQQHILTTQQESQLQRIEDPAQRAEARAMMLERKLAAMQSQPPAPAPQPQPARRESDEAYTARRTREILGEYNADFGLEGDNALNADAQGLDYSGEREFRASAARLAAARVQGETAMPKQPASNGTPAAQKTDDPVAQAAAQIRRELGIGGPLNPSAAPRTPGAVTTSQDFRNIVNQTGMTGRQRIKALRELEIKAPTPA